MTVRRTESPEAQLHDEDGACQQQGDGVGGGDGGASDEQAVDEPEGDPEGEQHVHAEGDALGLPFACDFEDLRDEAARGEDCGDVSDEFEGGGHGGWVIDDGEKGRQGLSGERGTGEP